MVIEAEEYAAGLFSGSSEVGGRLAAPGTDLEEGPVGESLSREASGLEEGEPLVIGHESACRSGESEQLVATGHAKTSLPSVKRPRPSMTTPPIRRMVLSDKKRWRNWPPKAPRAATETMASEAAAKTVSA